MGCMVEVTDTGVEVDVHVFDTKADAEHYVTRSRRYSLAAFHGPDDFYFYKSAVEGEHASIRRTRGGQTWRACFWIEGSAKVAEAPSVQGKPAWFGYARFDGEWHIVKNGSGNAISYASVEAALAGARFISEMQGRAA